MATNTSLEFIELKVKMKEEEEEPNTLFYYLAQIAAEIKSMRLKKHVSIESMLIKFKDANKDPAEMTEEELKAKMESSKAAWGAAAVVGKRTPPPLSRDGAGTMRSRRTK
jgi:hypothetical protein